MAFKKLRGVVPPLVTPLTREGKLDAAGLERLLENLIAGGAAGCFLLGTTGEGPAIGGALRRELILTSAKINAGRIPMLVGISDNAFESSLELAEFSREAGAYGAVAAPPSYFTLGEPELIDYYNALADQLTLPLFLYNMPSAARAEVTPQAVIKLAEHPNIIGHKDSSGNMGSFHLLLQNLKRRDDFSLFVGPEELMGEAVFFGADGGVPGGANLNPGLYVAMFEAASRQDAAAMVKLQAAIYSQMRIYGCGRHRSSLVKGLKCALKLRGLCEDGMPAPFRPFDEPERERVRAILAELS